MNIENTNKKDDNENNNNLIHLNSTPGTNPELDKYDNMSLSIEDVNTTEKITLDLQHQQWQPVFDGHSVESQHEEYNQNVGEYTDIDAYDRNENEATQSNELYNSMMEVFPSSLHLNHKDLQTIRNSLTIDEYVDFYKVAQAYPPLRKYVNIYEFVSRSC